MRRAPHVDLSFHTLHCCVAAENTLVAVGLLVRVCFTAPLRNCCSTLKTSCDFPKWANSPLWSCNWVLLILKSDGKQISLLLSASQLKIAFLFICINLGGEGIFRVCSRPLDVEMETKTPHCARPPQGREVRSCWVQLALCAQARKGTKSWSGQEGFWSRSWMCRRRSI